VESVEAENVLKDFNSKILSLLYWIIKLYTIKYDDKLFVIKPGKVDYSISWFTNRKSDVKALKTQVSKQDQEIVLLTRQIHNLETAHPFESFFIIIQTWAVTI